MRNHLQIDEIAVFPFSTSLKFIIMLKKYSIIIAGHASSVSLEPEFWEELKSIADSQGVSVNQLVTSIDELRDGNLSSALRLFVLREVKSKILDFNGVVSNL